MLRSCAWVPDLPKGTGRELEEFGELASVLAKTTPKPSVYFESNTSWAPWLRRGCPRQPLAPTSVFAVVAKERKAYYSVSHGDEYVK